MPSPDNDDDDDELIIEDNDEATDVAAPLPPPPAPLATGSNDAVSGCQHKAHCPFSGSQNGTSVTAVAVSGSLDSS